MSGRKNRRKNRSRKERMKQTSKISERKPAGEKESNTRQNE
jgi:hypothetical protein